MSEGLVSSRMSCGYLMVLRRSLGGGLISPCARRGAAHGGARASGPTRIVTSGSVCGAQAPRVRHGPVDAAVESMLRDLGAETGPGGVRGAGRWRAGASETFERANETNETRRALGLPDARIEAIDLGR